MKYPTFKSDNGDTYFIKKDNGKWGIYHYDPNAQMISTATDGFWNHLNNFASAIQAYKYMKENLDTIALI